ncbi:transcription termination/antitermination protein NusA [Candidatus Falkowbacteria bacterium]|nr:transcription termination/antitermination protein NusA [Candidatus Falkowbacteria bacterium]
MSDLTNAIKQICDEKGLSYEAVIETIESALAAAYRKDFGEKNQNIKVEFDPETGKSKVFDVKTVVEDLTEEEKKELEERAKRRAAVSAGSPQARAEDTPASFDNTQDKSLSMGVPASQSQAQEEVAAKEGEEEVRKFNPRTEIQLSDAKEIKKAVKIGDEIKMKLTPPDAYGRMAAQTAKQVIIQRLREAERNMIFDEFKDKENEVVSGVVQRREGKIVLIDLGKAVGILPLEEQIYNERYNPGDRIKVFVKGVNLTSRGAEVILSRTSDEILRKVFYLEIPEVSNGLVELKAVAREAGSRSKVAVAALSENIDPIGSCVGQRGARIQTIIAELGGEKVDIIQHEDEPEKFIANSLSPAKIINIEINKDEKKAVVTVNEDQLSLAIGKGGQNVRLAARLTGWKIDIVGKGPEKAKEVKEDVEGKKEEEGKEEEITDNPSASSGQTK